MESPSQMSFITIPGSEVIKGIGIGRDAEMEEQLITNSWQEHVALQTPRDAERFGDHDRLEQWMQKGRTVHWLLGENRKLAGIIWYGKEDFPSNIAPERPLDPVPEETFAIRLYEGYAGRGLARMAMTNSLTVAAHNKVVHNKEVPGIWLQTSSTNTRALAAYNRFGYEEVHRNNEKVTMVLHPKTIAQIAGIAGIEQPQIS